MSSLSRFAMSTFSLPLTLRISTSFGLIGLISIAGCARQSAESESGVGSATNGPIVSASRVQADALPAGASTVGERLARSPRHGEYAMIRTGTGDSVRAWVVYPERSAKAPVVIVVHEIFGLSSWVRGVADQFAADGFIAIAPDLLTGKVAPTPGSDTLTQAQATGAIRSLQTADVQRQLAAIGQYGMSLPAAQRRYGVVGFCWGGSAAFASAVASPPGQGAAVVYYGSSPQTASLASVKIPVLGLYGGEDARVNATIPPADSAMRALGKVCQPRIFPGAGHGFLRQQEGQAGANLEATRAAWPLTVSFFRTHLGQ